jgi:hypothetical protein
MHNAKAERKVFDSHTDVTKCQVHQVCLPTDDLDVQNTPKVRGRS